MQVLRRPSEPAELRGNLGPGTDMDDFPGGLNGSSQHSRKPACKNLKTLHFSRVLN